MATEEKKEEVKIELTSEQKEELAQVFQYREKAEYTDEEIKLLGEMFDTPEKLLILRKVLSIFTEDERGLSFPSPQNLVQASETDLKTYAIETAINNLAVEKIRIALLSLYRMLKASKTADKKEEFEKKNIKDFEEDKKKKKFNEEVEQAKEHLGENL